MRTNSKLLAVFAASMALAAASEARQVATSSATGGNRGGAFFGGFMPSNIVNKPVDIKGAAMPLNFQQTMMPQQQSTKVFNVNSAFRNVQMPLFRSHAPSTPVVAPGPGNPLQPTNPIQLQPLKVQPSTVPPWYR